MNDKNTHDIVFLPDRLNRIPTIFRGMTINELGKFALIGIGIGFVIGLLIFLIFHAWIYIFICMLVVPIPFIMYVSAKFTKLKRGKPDTWLERNMTYKMAKIGLGNREKLLFLDESFIITRGKLK